MTGWNLPPGVTDRMIDEAFGGTGGVRGTYTVTVTRTVFQRVEVEVEAGNEEDARFDAVIMAKTGLLDWSEADESEYGVEGVEAPDDGPDPDDERDARADYEHERDR